MITVASTGSVIADILFFAIAAALYFAPTIVAVIRKHQIASVAIVNTVLGWTLIGWIVALVMAVRDKPAAAVQPETSSPAVGSFCTNCGTHNPPTAGFCASCGRSMAGSTATDA